MKTLQNAPLLFVCTWLWVAPSIAPSYAAEPLQGTQLSDSSVLILDGRGYRNHQFRTLDIFTPNWRGEYISYELSNAQVTDDRPLDHSVADGEEESTRYSGLEQ